MPQNPKIAALDLIVTSEQQQEKKRIEAQKRRAETEKAKERAKALYQLQRQDLLNKAETARMAAKQLAEKFYFQEVANYAKVGNWQGITKV